MRKVSVTHREGSYPIIVGKGIRFELHKHLQKSYSKILIVTDETVAKLYLHDVLESLTTCPTVEYVLPTGEKSKSIEVFYDVQTKAIEAGLDRNSLIIALGGGVVGDLAGFVAATFMRGIDYIQVPTTILAHDSSVGGKVAINHPLGKNLIGAFHQPAGVYFDIDTLATLPEEEIRSGYAELIKEGLISDEPLFRQMLESNLDSITVEELERNILAGIDVKRIIVQADEKEHGIRSFLNLGHTLAHALEADLGYGKITHGEAVAIGLLFSIHVSERVYNKELPFKTLKDWLIANKYPLDSFSFDLEQLIRLMKSDKKAVNERINMVLMKAVGSLQLEAMTDEALRNHLETFRERLV